MAQELNVADLTLSSSAFGDHEPIPSRHDALDDDLALEPGLDRRALLDRIEDHVIEQARVVGTYANGG